MTQPDLKHLRSSVINQNKADEWIADVPANHLPAELEHYRTALRASIQDAWTALRSARMTGLRSARVSAAFHIGTAKGDRFLVQACEKRLSDFGRKYQK